MEEAVAFHVAALHDGLERAFVGVNYLSRFYGEMI